MFHSTYFASRASAKTPAASGAAAEVPECVLVHLPYRSVVACKRMSYDTIIQHLIRTNPLPLRCEDLWRRCWRWRPVCWSRTHRNVHSVRRWSPSWWRWSTCWLRSRRSCSRRLRRRHPTPKRRCCPNLFDPVDQSSRAKQTGISWCSPLFLFHHHYSSYLIDAPDNGPHGGISRSVHRLAVISGTPAGAVDVNQIRLVAHGVGLNQVGHVGLVEHANAGHLRVVGDTYAADAIVALGRHLTGATSAVAGVRIKIVGVI